MFVVRFTKRLFGKGKRGIAPIPALPALAPALPSPLLINALQLHRLDNEAESVTLMPSANVDTDEERRDKEVTIPCDWATDSQGHPNAVYVKSQLQIFVKEVIVKAFPALMPVWSAEDQILSFSGSKETIDALIEGFFALVGPHCPPPLEDCLRLLIEESEKNQDYIEKDFHHGCLFIRTPTCWITSFVDRWEDHASYHSSHESSELSFVIGRPDSLNVREIGEEEGSSARVHSQGGIYMMDPTDSSGDAPIIYRRHEMVNEWRWSVLQDLSRSIHRERRTSFATL